MCDTIAVRSVLGLCFLIENGASGCALSSCIYRVRPPTTNSSSDRPPRAASTSWCVVSHTFVVVRGWKISIRVVKSSHVCGGGGGCVCVRRVCVRREEEEEGESRRRRTHVTSTAHAHKNQQAVWVLTRWHPAHAGTPGAAALPCACRAASTRALAASYLATRAAAVSPSLCDPPPSPSG